MNQRKTLRSALVMNLGLGLLLVSLSEAAEKKSVAAPSAAPAPAEESAEQVNVDKIKEKYWARGDESELGVVQNRTYSKEKKFELGVIGGITASDPFLSVKNLGTSFGYHFSEYFAVHLLAWKSYVSPSSAKLKLEEGSKRANTNDPKSFIGAEGTASLLYGKLSLMGQKIIYYDFHVSGGGGMTNTETGNNLTYLVGVGQNVYISKQVSLRVDYRLLVYRETLVEREIQQIIGQPIGTRTNFSNTVSLGFTFLTEFFK